MSDKNKLELDKSFIEAGKEYFQNKNYSSALESFQKVLKDDPCNKDVLFEIGKTYYVMQQYLPAIDFLRDAKEKKPNNEHAYLLLAKAYSGIGNYDQTINELLQLKELGSCTIDIERELFLIYQDRYGRLTSVRGGLDELNSTIDIYQQRLDMNPIDEKAISHLVQIYNFKGDYELAKEKARLALQNIPATNLFLRNKILNELEIAEKKTILSSKIRSLYVTLSRRCNLSCIMCLPPTFPWEIPYRTIKEIYSLLPWLEKIMWQGGDVFFLDYFEDIFSEVSRYPNIRQSIVTNAQLINQKIAEKLIKNNVELTVSVDGTSKEIYEYIRRGARFETLIKNLKVISELKKSYPTNMILNLNVVIMKSNYHQLESFVDFAKEYGFESLCLMPMEISIKKQFNTPEDIFVYNKDSDASNFISKVSPIVEKKAQDYGIRLENRLPVFSKENSDSCRKEKTDHIQENTDTQVKGLLCHIPWQQLLIDFDGIVRPDCQCSCEKTVGSILDSPSLEDIWNNKAMQDYRKAMINRNYLGLCNPECISGKISETHLKIP